MSFYAYLVDKEKTLVPYGPGGVWDKVCLWVLHNVYGARYWRESFLVAAANRESYYKEEILRLEKKVVRYMEVYIKAIELGDAESFCGGVQIPDQKDFPGEEIEVDGGAYFGMSDAEFLAEERKAA